MKIKVSSKTPVITNTKPQTRQISRVDPDPPKKQSYLKRFINTIIDDIMYKLNGIKSEDRERWEDFENFCKLSKGKRQ